jgi:3',5'-cyclic AMP phosphodiesterase CpdA
MTLLVHLSDLHMAKDPRAQRTLFDKLVEALRREREAARPERVAVVITGDVFDSASDPAAPLVANFLDLHGRIVEALGGDAPTIVIPGNHDRRRAGLFGPHSETLFRRLHDAVDPRRVYVGGHRTPFLAQLVPPEMHGIPAHVIAYDSSYLPHGFIGAGGTIRLEDLLQVHARLPDDGRPILLLVHHHLIPTPITDISHVDSMRTPRIARWLVGTALPALVSNADREELTMTALGAGTALSTLHSFARAVLLLHGHKHVPTARLLRGMTAGSGDLLLASTGSAGIRERVHVARHPDTARLWPSFNLVLLKEGRVRIESVSFSPKKSKRAPLRRELARAQRVGNKWDPEPVNFRVRDAAVRVDRDEASFSLSPSSTSNHRWDFACERNVVLKPGAKLRRYVDFVHALAPQKEGTLLKRARPDTRANRRVELATDGPTHYEVQDGLCRTLAEGGRSYGAGSAFEWVGLLCRYGAARATLRLACSDSALREPFGSVTDLTIGRERPTTVTVADNHWIVTWESCPPRSLLRIYWPLAR